MVGVEGMQRGWELEAVGSGGLHTAGVGGVWAVGSWRCVPTLRVACVGAAEPPCLRELEKIQIQEAAKMKPGELGLPGPLFRGRAGEGQGAPWGALLALHMFGGGVSSLPCRHLHPQL